MNGYGEFQAGLKWSALANLGTLPVMKMVMFVPFVGTIILFNDSVVNLLSLSLPILERFGATISPQEQQALTINNFYLLYFGLLALGIGSIVFSIWCPNEIKAAPDVDRFVEKFDKVSSSVAVRRNFHRLIDLEKSATKRNQRSAYCDDLFHNLIVEIFREMEARDLVPADDSFYNGAGYIDVEQIVNIVSNDAKAVWAFSKPFQDISVHFSGDILHCLYAFLDLRHFYVRHAVATLYFAGLLLLFVPTVKTFIKIVT